MTRRILAVLAAALLIVAVSTVPAEARKNFGQVINRAGASIWVDCSLESKPHADHLLYQDGSGRKYRSSQFSGCSDADAFYLRYDKRCVMLSGLVSPNPTYVKADPGHWLKIPGASIATAYAWGDCKNAPWISKYLKRLS